MLTLQGTLTHQDDVRNLSDVISGECVLALQNILEGTLSHNDDVGYLTDVISGEFVDIAGYSDLL